jgi:hypothetical protein
VAASTDSRVTATEDVSKLMLDDPRVVPRAAKEQKAFISSESESDRERSA